MQNEWISLLKALSYLVRRAKGNCLYVKYSDIYRACLKLKLTPPTPYKLHKLMKEFNVRRDEEFVRGGKVTWVLRKSNRLWLLLEKEDFKRILEKSL